MTVPRNIKDIEPHKKDPAMLVVMVRIKAESGEEGTIECALRKGLPEVKQEESTLEYLFNGF